MSATPVRLVALVVLLGVAPATERLATAQANAVTTVILVRHAERESGTGDDPLSAHGRERAQALARMLRDTGVTTVITSGLTRTRETAEPFARQANLTPEVIPPDQVDGVVERVRSLAGGTVLIVHHSNTVPVIAEKFGAKIPPIADQEFDRLTVLTIPLSGSPSVVTLRYGASPGR